MKLALRTSIAAIAVGMMMFAGLAPVSGVAQEDESGFPLPANTAYCEPGYLGPFEGCTPWEGVTVSYTSADGTFNDSCTTAAGERSATCSMTVPFGSDITASIDPSVIPSGYVLEGSASLTFEIPDGPPEGQFGGPSFVLLPEPDDSGDEGDADDETNGTVTGLPDTGSGRSGADENSALLASLVAACLITLSGTAVLRRRMH